MPGYGKKMMYGTGGSKMKGYGKGGSLKPVPSDNKGLSKLPTAVRNKMGYMHNGGSPSKGKKGVMVISIGVGKIKKKTTTKKKKKGGK